MGTSHIFLDMSASSRQVVVYLTRQCVFDLLFTSHCCFASHVIIFKCYKWFTTSLSFHMLFPCRCARLSPPIPPGLGIRSFTHRSFAHSLISIKSNERLRAIRLDRSRQMSNHEGIAQRKWATASELLRLLKTNERPWAIRSGRSPKMSAVSESLRSLTKNERPWVILSCRSEKMSDREQIAQVTHQKWVNCSFF